MFEITLRDEYHASLFLLDRSRNKVMDMIDFGYYKSDEDMKFWFSAPRKQKPTPYRLSARCDSWIAQGQEKHLRQLWEEKARPMAQKIDDAKIKVTHIQRPDVFNCRTGVIFCLQAMGMVYVPSLATKNDDGTMCNINDYKLHI